MSNYTHQPPRPERLFIVIAVAILFVSAIALHSASADPIIADHSTTDITAVPQAAIEAAKADLHIAYGHTSHGSQITSGMSGLVDFANNGGLGMSLSQDIFEWNNGGSNGGLDLEEGDGYGDGWMDHDAGYYPNWVNETREYLDDPSHSDVNVIVWSWCGQVSGLSEQQMIDFYLDPMSQLEMDYSHVTFVYMTGHADGSGETGNLHLRNQQIRDYCIANDKVLFDFYDIECYDPDGNYYGDKQVNDGCYYDSDGNGTLDRNWAIDWQNSHIEGYDWYDCSSAHSQPLNANLKAYAAWWLWARLAGWGQCTSAPGATIAVADDDLQQITVEWADNSDDEDYFIIQRQVNGGIWDNAYAGVDANTTTFIDENLLPGIYSYRILAHRNDDGSGTACDSAASPAAQAEIIDHDLPAPPSDLTADADSINGMIHLTWTDNSHNEDGFVIERRIDNGSFAVLNEELAPDTVTFTNAGLIPLHTYTYRIKAVNRFGSSAWSNEAGQTIYSELETITLNNEDTGEVVDAFLRSAAPDSNFGSTSYLTDYDRFIMQFNLPEEVMNKKIVSAELSVYVWAVDPADTGAVLPLYPVTRAWDENSVTWNLAETGTSWDTGGGDTGAAVGELVVENIDHQFLTPCEITELVQQWVDGEKENFGLILDKEVGVEMGVKASEYSQHASPYLMISYTAKICTDFDLDGDVDGEDLVQLINNFDQSCISHFAEAFGQ